MLLVALTCIAAGTWQITRFDGKVSANGALRHNAHATAVPVADVLPLTTSATEPGSREVRFRTIIASGEFDATHQVLVRNRSVYTGSGDDSDSSTGFYVLTPLRTSAGQLLVVRGFIPASTVSSLAPIAPAPPSGQVTVRARAQAPETNNDKASLLPAGQVDSINPIEQAQRLASPVYNGYVELIAGQPGTDHLTAIASPDLSNPAGGAVEPQHFAYIIQWYLFAGLALAAPFVMARSENRHEGHGEVDIDEITPLAPAESAAPADVPAEPTSAERRAAKLADRYGRAVR
jgi:cytochrome oxidase assembly protein ShyY1